MGKYDSDKARGLARLRQRAGLAQKDAAAFFGVSRQAISEWENGVERGSPNRYEDFIAYLVEGLEAKPKELMDIWVELMVGEWKWPPLDERKLPPGYLSQEPIPSQNIRRPDYFVGREEILARLEELLAVDEAAPTLFIFEGPAGAGKTVLAQHVFHRFRTQFPDGALFATPATSPIMEILLMLGKAYGQDVRGLTDEETRAAAVRSELATKRALFLIDDAETQEQIHPLLPDTGPLKVIVTTRRRGLLTHYKVHRFDIGPFNPDSGASLALFVQVLEEENKQYNENDLAKIGALLGHFPLAIAIAAGRLVTEPGLTAAELLAQLQKRDKPLDELEGNRSAKNSFASSYDSLPPPLQRFYPLLAVHGGKDFGVEAAAAVARISRQEAKRHLRHLYRASLVETSAQVRYHLHPLLRAFALEKVDPDTPYHRMIDYYHSYLLEHPRDYTAVDAEASNIRSALDEAHARGMHSAVLSITHAFFRYLESRGLYGEAEERLQQGREHFHAAGPAEQAAILADLGRLRRRQGDHDRALDHFEEALPQALKSDNKKVVTGVYEGMANIYGQRGKFDEAEEYCHLGLEAAQAGGYEAGEADLYQILGAIALHRQKFSHADEYLLEGLDIAEKIGYPERETLLAANLATLAYFQKQLRRARELFQKCLSLARESQHKKNVVDMLAQLGAVEIELREYESAKERLLEALALLETIDDPEMGARVNRNLGEWYARQADYSRSNTHFQEARQLARGTKNALLLAGINCDWGHYLADHEKWDEAERLFQEAQERNNESDREIAAKTIHGLARVAAAREASSLAREQGRESIDLYEEFDPEKAEEVRQWLDNLPGGE